jgi:hypothetical protein
MNWLESLFRNARFQWQTQSIIGILSIIGMLVMICFMLSLMCAVPFAIIDELLD